MKFQDRISQYVDTKATAASILKVTKDSNSLLVHSVFVTHQGEMPFAGKRALFIRLGGCNRGNKVGVGCNGCDTDFRMSQSTVMSVPALAQQVMDMLVTHNMGQFYHAEHDKDGNYKDPARTFDGRPLIVITGGEPTLQTENILNLIGEIWFMCNNRTGENWEPLFQVETNGDFLTKWFDSIEMLSDWKIRGGIGEEAEVSGDIPGTYIVTVVSPKLGKTCKWGGGYELLEREPYHSVFVRYVVSGDPESPYYNIPSSLVDLYLKRSRYSGTFFLSPMTVYKKEVTTPGQAHKAVDEKATRACVKRAIELSEKFNLPISYQTHVPMGLR